MTNTLNFSPFPVLSSENIVLRAPENHDLKAFAALRSNAENAQYLRRSTNNDESETKLWLNKIIGFAQNNVSILWVIEDKQSSKFLGSICLWNFSEDKFEAEVGYELFPEEHGKGFMSAAIQAVINFAKTIRLREIEAYTHFENKASLKLLQRNGFIWLPEKKDPDVETNVIYSLKLSV